MKLHAIETIETPKGAPFVRRMAVFGGWIYYTFEDGNLVSDYVPDPTAPHCRSRARWFQARHSECPGIRTQDVNGMVCIVRETDRAISEFPTIAEAHDALGSDSPWVEVTE